MVLTERLLLSRQYWNVVFLMSATVNAPIACAHMACAQVLHPYIKTGTMYIVWYTYFYVSPYDCIEGHIMNAGLAYVICIICVSICKPCTPAVTFYIVATTVCIFIRVPAWLHTRSQHECKGASIILCTENSTPCKIVTHEGFNLKLTTRDHVADITHHATLGSNRPSGGFPPNRGNITLLWFLLYCFFFSILRPRRTVALILTLK